MSVYSIYFSPTNSTEKIVKLIATEFGEFKTIDLSCKNAHFDYTFNEDDICIFGVPSYGGRVPQTATERMSDFTGNNARAIMVVSYGNRAYEDTLVELQDILTQHNFNCVAGMAVVTEHSIMHKYAKGRPNQEDQKQIKNFAHKIISKINKNVLQEVLYVPGNHPYKEYHTIPLHPKTNSKCTNCGMCAKLCPVGAISKDSSHKVDTNLCISCMRCVKICPRNAKSVNKLKVKLASMKMKKVCSTRKENELFI